MALRIWINRVSKPVRRILGHYGAACVATIAAIAFCLPILPRAANAEARPLFCVLVPHFKDEYWLSVGFGLEQEAARQAVDLLVYEAGGYRDRAAQIAQLDLCVARGADAILIGAVTSDHPDLIQAIASVAERVPVLAVVNALESNRLSARIGVDWQGMGRAIGDHLSALHPAGTPAKTALLVSGPPEAGWTGLVETGLRAALTTSSVTILEVFGADTGLRPQLSLVETALSRHPDADYLIGSAPAIEAAFGLIAAQTTPDPPALLSLYVNHSVLRGLMNGQVQTAAFDDPVRQGIMAIRQAVGATPLSDAARLVGPDIVLLTRADPDLDQIRISPAGYFPKLQ